MLETLEVSASELAQMLGVTDRRIRQLAKEGTVIRGVQRGRYRLQKSVRRFLDVRKEQHQSVSLDALREERLKTLRITRAQKDRELIALDEAIEFADEVIGLFVASLQGLPARITNNIAERRRLNEIFDQERQRLADRFAERLTDYERLVI